MTVPQMTAEALDNWIERVGAAWVIDGIEEMNRAGARNMRYLIAILSRWEESGRDAKPASPPDMLGQFKHLVNRRTS